MKKMSARTAIIILVVLAVLGVSLVLFLTGKQNGVNYKTIIASKSDILQTVSETGTVKASQELELSFLNNGKLQRLNFKIGDQVKEGQLLAELDYTSLVVSRQEAQANYDVATQNLNKLLAGATSEERALAEATVRQAQSTVESAKNELVRTKENVSETIAQAEKTFYDLESDSSDTLTTSEQAIKTAETNLNNAKSTKQKSIDDTRDVVLITIEDKISTANTALDAVDKVLSDEDAKDYLSVKSHSYKTSAKSYYKKAIDQKALAQSTLVTAKLSLSRNAVDSAMTNADYLLELSLAALENTFSALDNSITSNLFSQSDIDSYKTTISTNLGIINTAISALNTAEQNYKNAILDYETSIKSFEDALAQARSAYSDSLIKAENALKLAKTNGEQQITSAESRVRAAEETLIVAEAQRDKTLATATSYDISLNRAKVRQAQAALDSINKQIENSQIKAPIDGVITSVNYEIGEQVLSGQTVISVLGEGDYEIEVLISEADIAKVKVGDQAEISLDAFGEDVLFEGSVVFIEPAETIIQDVIYYQVKIKFDPENQQIKSGMTANIVITTNQKNNVLNVPSRSIIDKGAEGKFIRLLIANQMKEQKVITGLRGDGGNVEILDGLNAGDVIITQIIEN